MAAAWAWFRLDAARRWRSLAALGLLIAVAGAVVLTAVAGARRGDSALGRLSARTLPATATVMPFQPGFDWAPVRAMPEVEALATYLDTSFALAGIPEQDLAVGRLPEASELMRTVERPVVLRGRLADPARADEAVVTPRFVASHGLGVGDTVTALLLTPEQVQANPTITGPEPAGPRPVLHIVGVIRSPVFSDGPQSHGTLVPTPALLRRYRPNLLDRTSWSDGLVRLRGGEAALPAFTARLAALTGRSDINVQNMAEQQRHRQRAAAFEARWLLAFGAAAFVAALVLIGQALVRYVGASLADLQVLRALGMTRAQSVLAAVAGPLLATAPGAGVGIAVAAVASRWFPIGSAANAEPAPGLDVDPLVLGLGGLLTVALVAAAAAAAARLAVGSARPGQRTSARRRSSIAAAAAGAHLPVPVLVGARFALEPSRGPLAVPVRPALFGAVAGVLGVVAAFTFSAGVREAAGNPERFGQTWQLEAWVGFGGTDFTSAGLLAAVARDRDVIAVNDWRAAVATDVRSRLPLELYSYRPVGRPVAVVLTAGRMPAAANETVLAPASAAALGARVGSTVTLAGTTGTPRAMTLTGIGFVPAGSHCGACEATGAWVTDGGFDALFVTFQFHGGAIVVRPGARVDEVTTRLQRAAAVGGGEALFAPPFPPPGAAEIRRVQALPLALGAFLALLAIGAVGHALATAVRRRRHDLAVLRALGMTRRQTRGVVVTQASVLAVTGLAFGVPLGLALGRTVWRVVADYTPLFYVPPVAPWALLLVGPVVLLVANLLAAWPGRRAARLRIGDVLRAE
ncbi:MAG: putative transport system permease protein [Mycobacteriales bacterium]